MRTTGAYGIKLEYNESRIGHLALTKGGNGLYIDLDKRQRLELALSMLADDHEITYVQSTGKILLTEKLPPAPNPQEGEYYRVPGKFDMDAPWCHSPIARVKKRHNDNYIMLEAAGGEETGWSDMRALEGPLKIKTEWIEEEA